MKKYPLLTLTLLLMTASAAFSQTWFKIVPAESQTVTVALPAGSSIRWCDAASGKVCSPVEPISAKTTITAYCPSVSSCAGADLTDGLNGVAKDVEVLETTAVQTVTVNGTAVTVPALPPTTYPPIAFTPGVSYTFTASNVPSSTGPLTVTLTIGIGNVSVPLTCTFGATVANGTAAAFSCIPAPIASK